jgi:hypothetical protein
VDELARRLADAGAALATLDEAIAIARRSRIERDGAVLRLVYTFETIWQACQQLLADREKVVTGTANQTIRAAHRLGWLSDAKTEAIAEILDHRNLVAHSYRDEIGNEIEARLVAHAAVLRGWLDELRKQAGT